MRDFRIAISFLLVLLFSSCQPSLVDFATKWTKDIKGEIIKDANQQPTRIVYDSAGHDITLFKGDKKLKYFWFKPEVNNLGHTIFKDTGVVIFYSSDQNFEYVKELCPVSDRSFEGIKYKGEFIGLTEFRYCNGMIKKSGFSYNGDSEVLKEYDSTGKIIKDNEAANINYLKEILKIKYDR